VPGLRWYGQQVSHGLLHPDVEIVGLCGHEISNWWRLSLPPGVFAGRWGLVVRGDGVFEAIAVTRDNGRVALGHSAIGVSEDELAKLRQRLDCDLIAVVDRGTWARVSANAEGRALRQGDYLGQWLVFYDALRRLRGRALWTSPPLLDLLPPLSEEALARAFDLLIPDGTSVVAYVFDEGAVHASLIATKEGGMVDSLAMHPGIADLVPSSAIRSWHTQYRSINDAVGQRFATPSISVFTDVATVRRIQRGPRDQLSRELAQKNLIIDPMPTWLAGLVGGAAAAMIAGKSAQALSRFLPRSARRAAGAVAGAAVDRLRESGAHPLAVLGFDPLLLWSSVQRWYRSESADGR